jgi:hypothetical protein
VQKFTGSRALTVAEQVVAAVAAHLSKLFASQLPVSFRPLHLPGISLHLEILVAFRSAKSKDLQHGLKLQRDVKTERDDAACGSHLAIIPSKADSVPWINIAGAKPALFKSHSLSASCCF